MFMHFFLHFYSGEKTSGISNPKRTAAVKTATPLVRSQPQYSSLAILERDNDMSYKVSSTNNGVSGKEKILEEYQDDEDIASIIATMEASSAKTATAVKSDTTVPLNTIEKITKVEKLEIIQKDKQVPTRKTSAPVAGPSADGWGSAFKSSGIGANKIKKSGKGLSMAKPLITKKNVSSTSLIDIAESTDREKRDIGLAITRSFDDLKQIGRLKRDLMAQQLEGVSSIKKTSSNNILSMSIEDFPSLDVLPPPQKATNGNNSRSRDSTIPVPPTLPPGLSIEQRNESIKAFVEEVRRKKELDQASSSSSEKDSQRNASSADTKDSKNSTKKISNENGIGWAKTGGHTEKIDAISNSSVSSVSNIDYPSLAPSTQSTSSGVNTLKWGEKPPPPPPKTASDLLLAKKNKAASKIKNQQDDRIR
jgi:hypothetical protein